MGSNYLPAWVNPNFTYLSGTYPGTRQLKVKVSSFQVTNTMKSLTYHNLFLGLLFILGSCADQVEPPSALNQAIDHFKRSGFYDQSLEGDYQYLFENALWLTTGSKQALLTPVDHQDPEEVYVLYVWDEQWKHLGGTEIIFPAGISLIESQQALELRFIQDDRSSPEVISFAIHYDNLLGLQVELSSDPEASRRASDDHSLPGCVVAQLNSLKSGDTENEALLNTLAYAIMDCMSLE